MHMNVLLHSLILCLSVMFSSVNAVISLLSIILIGKIGMCLLGIVLIGEIGGTAEEDAAAFIRVRVLLG